MDHRVGRASQPTPTVDGASIDDDTGYW